MLTKVQEFASGRLALNSAKSVPKGMESDPTMEPFKYAIIKRLVDERPLINIFSSAKYAALKLARLIGVALLILINIPPNPLKAALGWDGNVTESL